MSESTAIAEAKNTAVANIDAQLSAMADAIKKNISVSGNYIGVQKNGQFLLPSGEQRAELDMVIVDYRYRKQFYDKPYRQGEFSEAKCFAIGTTDVDLVPNDASPQLQHPSCNTCPHNQFGSALDGGRGKACSDQLLLAVMFPDLGESEEIFLLKASATAVKQVAGHILKMVTTVGHPIKAVTRFTIEVGNYQKLQAAYGGANPAYVEHWNNLATAARMLEAVPRKSDAPAGTTTAVDSAAARGKK